MLKLGRKLIFRLVLTSFILGQCRADPSKIVSNFQSFSKELLALASDSEEASDTKPGVNLYNPFGIGYLLANINEQLWNVSNFGIAEAIKTQEKYVSDDYGYLLGQFKQNKFKITSTIYSRFSNVTKTPGISKLLSHLITLDFVAKPMEFVDSFTNLLDLSTRGHLDNELLPKALWQQVFENSTQGAYINTMYFKTKLLKPWTDIGERSFNYDTIIKFLEIDGEFPVLQNENLTAVIIKIQETPSREIIFIKPHSYIPFTRLRQEINKVLISNGSWPLRKLRVQIPALNITNLSRHNLGMSLMGINETFCRLNGTEPFDEEPIFVQQPITQASHFEFASGFIEFSSATASIVTNRPDPSVEGSEVDEYDDDYSGVNLLQENEETDDETIIIPNHNGPDLLSRKSRSINRYQYQRAMEQVLKSDNEKCENPEEFGSSHRMSQSLIHNTTKTSSVAYSYYQKTFSSTSETLIFDTPFTWIIRDGVLGEAVSGSVSSLCQYNKVINAINSNPAHAWLHDVFKLAFWKCA